MKISHCRLLTATHGRARTGRPGADRRDDGAFVFILPRLCSASGLRLGRLTSIVRPHIMAFINRKRMTLLSILFATGIALIVFYQFYQSNPYLFSIKQTVHGDYFRGFETNGLIPAGSNEYWSVDDPNNALSGRTFPVPGKPENSLKGASIIVEAFVSRPGYYGHLGAGSREIKIVKLIRSEPLTHNTAEQLLQRLSRAP